MGKKVASSIVGGEIFALKGDLGSGKTTFVQGLAEGLGIKGRIISPTFILMRRYQLPFNHEAINYFYHVDLYRLEEKVDKEVVNLGIADVWGEKENIMVIEWAEKIKDLIPANSKWLFFENIGENKRKITLKE